MKKLLAFLAVTGVACLLVVLLAQDFVLCAFFENKISRMTGFKAKIGDFHYQYPGALHIQGLRLYNPPGFENPLFAECSRIYIIFNMPEFLRRERLKIYDMDINLREIHLEKTPVGVSNIGLLKPFAAGQKAGRRSLPFELDRITLTLRNIDFQDRGAPDSRKMASPVRIEREEYGPVDDPDSIFALIASKIVEGSEFGKDLGLEASL